MAYKQQVTIGNFLVVAGSAAAIGGASSDASANKGLIWGGGAIAFIGLLINVSAISHIGRAGIILRGNSIILPIGKK